MKTRTEIEILAEQMPTSFLIQEDRRLTDLPNPTAEEDLMWAVYRDELHDRRFPEGEILPLSWAETIKPVHVFELDQTGRYE